MYTVNNKKYLGCFGNPMADRKTSVGVSGLQNLKKRVSKQLKKIDLRGIHNAYQIMDINYPRHHK
jgi:hypothetical protein